MIVDIVELLIQKDNNFSKLFDDASKASKTDLLGKMVELETNKTRRVKNANCTMKFNREVQGIEIKAGDLNICVCEVEDAEMEDVSRGEDEIKFAFIKTREDSNVVEYCYSLCYQTGEIKLMPTIVRQGQGSPSFSVIVDLSDADLQVLKGEAQFNV